MIGAVLYVRVSTKEQTENLSLPTQLKACEDYCARHGMTVIARFVEQGESAKSTNRTELQRMLTLCRKRKGEIAFVVVYNLTRFARESHDHFVLRAHLHGLGISLRSVTEPIDDTATGQLMEGVLAAFAQFDNDLKSERTKAGMRAAWDRGRWTFIAPLGYLNSESKQGPSLVHDPERARLIAKAFDDFATGRYTRQAVLANLTAAGLRSRNGKILPPQAFANVLRNPAYIGRLEVGDVSKVGDFAPLVPETTFYRVQALLDGRIVSSGPRPKNHPDFPLRGFVTCEACGRPLTGSWSKGRNGYYAYYHCQRQCRATNVSKADLEQQFVELLEEVQPSAAVMRLVKARLVAKWTALKAEARKVAAANERRVAVIQQRLDRLDDAFLFAGTIDQQTYGRQRDKLREQQALARMDRHASELDHLDVEAILSFAEAVLPSAAKMWVQASLDQRQRLQRVLFADGLRCRGNRLYRTAATIPFVNELRAGRRSKQRVVAHSGPNWNHFGPWLQDLDALRRAA